MIYFMYHFIKEKLVYSPKLETFHGLLLKRNMVINYFIIETGFVGRISTTEKNNISTSEKLR